MSWIAHRRGPSLYEGWAALGWSFTALVGAGLLGALALPGTSPTPFGHYTRADFLKPEWLVLATLLAYPVYLASRSSWWVAVPVAAILSAQSWCVVDSAVDAMRLAGVAGSADAGWYALAAAQVGVYAVAAAAGCAACLGRRRWLRRMRALAPELAASAEEPVEQAPAWP